MGNSSSKANEEDFQNRTGSLRRSSKGRRSTKAKTDQCEAISQALVQLKNEIDIFEGNRSNDRYKQFQEMLTTFSKNLQQIRSKSKKQEHRDRCDQTLGEIQNCFQRLETRVSFNEQNDRALDMAAVESHSFINHSFQNKKSPQPPALLNEEWAQKLPQSNKQKQPKFDTIKNFERLQQEAQNLEQDIRRCIDLEDYKQFKILEKKIEILYADLEMITTEDHTPLGEKKAALGKRLIRCNNQIKKAKKGLENKISENASKSDGAGFSKPARSNMDYNREKDDWPDFSKTEDKLADLEIQALTFEGFKSDRKYKELEQILENHWTKVYSMDAFGDKEKVRKEQIIKRIQNIMQELRKRAEENEQQDLAIKKLRKIEAEVQQLTKNCDEYQGTSQDAAYLVLDQNMRSIWATIMQIGEPNEHVRRSKAKVIAYIQDVLKKFSQDAKSREESSSAKQVERPISRSEDPVNDDIIQSQLLKQVREFQNHWDQLNYNLEVRKISKSDVSKSIVEILEKVIDGLSKKRNALVIVEKRKSTGSLVIVKMIDNTDMLATVQTVNSRSMQDLMYPSSGNNQSHEVTNLTSTKRHSYSVTPDLLPKQVATSPIPKTMETEIKAQPIVKTIGEIQRVGAEAKALLQQIRQSNCTKNDEEYNKLGSKLEKCQKALESIHYNKKSDTIDSTRRRTAKTINEAFRALEEKGAKVPDEQQKVAAIRSSRAQEVMDIDAELQYFRQQIKIFTGVTKDKQYEKIKQGLSDCLTKLQLMDDMHMNKQDSIRHIQHYHQELETKLAENQAKVRVSEQNAAVKRQLSQDLRAIIEQVQRAKGQVERFSGVHDGVLYKQIAQQLNGCTQTLDKMDAKGDPKLEHAKVQTKEKVRKYLMILEEKSMKPITVEETHYGEEQNGNVESQAQNYQQNLEATAESTLVQQQAQLAQPRKSQLMDPNSPHYKINSLRDKLVEIKTQTEMFSGRFQDDHYRNIEMDIVNCLEELKLIDDRGHKSVIFSKNQYEDYIDKLLQYFEERSKINENAVRETPKAVQTYALQANHSPVAFKIPDPTEDLAIVEGKINEIKGEINQFPGTSTDENYKEIFEVLQSLTAKLNEIEVGNVAHVRERKRKLIEELVICNKSLEEKVGGKAEAERPVEIQEQYNKIEKILKEVQETSREVESFEGTKNDKKFCYLDEVLIRLMIALDNTDTYGNSDLREYRKNAIQSIQKTMKVLSDRVKLHEEQKANATPSVV